MRLFPFVSAARHEWVVEQLEDALDRLSVYECEGPTIPFDELVAQLGLDDDEAR